MPPMKRPLPDLDPSTTALVLIDLQRGITSRPTQPGIFPHLGCVSSAEDILNSWNA